MGRVLPSDLIALFDNRAWRHTLPPRLQWQAKAHRARKGTGKEAADAEPVQHGCPGADLRCTAWTQCSAARWVGDWGDAADEEDHNAVSCAFQGAAPPRRRRPRQSHSALRSCRPHTRRCWPSPFTSSRRGSLAIKGAGRSQTLPHTHTPDHLAHTHLSGYARSYVLTFVVVTILSAMDFWTVKNVSGRLLVGLRWWNDVDEAGQNHWRFESFEARGRPRPRPWLRFHAASLSVCVCPSLGRRSSDSSTRQTAASSGGRSSRRPSSGGYSPSSPSSPSRSCGPCSHVRQPPL